MERWLVILAFLAVTLLLLDGADGQPGGRSCTWKRPGRDCPEAFPIRDPIRRWRCCRGDPGSCKANDRAWCDCVDTQLTGTSGLLATFTTFEALQTALNDLTSTTCSIDPSDATTLAGCPDVLGNCLNRLGFNNGCILEKVCDASDPTIEVDDLTDGDTQIATAIGAGTANIPDKLCLYYRTFGALPNAAISP